MNNNIKNLEKKIKISITFFTNFRPMTINYFQPKFKKSRYNNRVYCRNFFLFLLLMKYYNKKSLFNGCSIFIKPVKKKVYTILRAPYRHKLSRHQWLLSRYFIIFTFNYFFKNDFFLKSTKNFEETFFILKKMYSFIESNILYQHKINYNFFVKFPNNFYFNY